MASTAGEKAESSGGEEDPGEEQAPESPTRGVEGDDDSLSHLPLAPNSEIFDVPTTVDPSYIISLIRKILPYEKIIDKGSITEVDEKEGTCHLLDHSDQCKPATDTWEDCGCILWDLSVEKDHAAFMVDNLLLEVLLANISTSSSSRITEICLGIIGNLACHENLASILISQKGLVNTVVNHLFLDDSACLFETFRLLTVCLRGSGSASWVKAVQPEQVLARILWISENTLNTQLLEKNIELLLTIVDDQEAGQALLPSLNKLGLPTILHSLLESEMSKLMDESKIERISIIDMILQSIESISTVDDYSQVLSSNKELFHVLCRIVKLPDKMEVSVLCPTAVVIIANILTDDTHLGVEASQDMHFLKGLLEILPLVSSDVQARNALWSILARLLSYTQEDRKLKPQQQLSIIIDNAYLIEEDLDGHPDQGSEEGSKHGVSPGENLNLTVPALRRLAGLLNHWILEASSSSNAKDEMLGKANRLVGYCLKYAT